MGSFTDLRLNQVDGRPDESFWPSFTDIMMVVVMIFLITSATLILRNTELMRKLTESEEATQIAAEIAEDSQAENVTLDEHLREIQRQLALARLQQLQTMEEKFGLRERLDITRERLSELEHRYKELHSELNTARVQNGAFDKMIADLHQQLNRSQLQQSSTADELASTAMRLHSTNQTFDELRKQYEASRDELARLKTEKLAKIKDVQLSDEELIRLRAEYVDLRSKYDKLVRPARATKGKYVVSVRYTRIDNDRVIMLKKPEDNQFYPIDSPAMNAELSDLKRRFNDKLYIKIIIPDDSNLSYNEAWTFTHDLLNRYDYYHQGGYQAAPILQ